MHKMFGSRTTTTTSTSKFYTNLEKNDDNENETTATTTATTTTTTTTTTILDNYNKIKNKRDSVSATSDDGNSQDSDSNCIDDQQEKKKNQQDVQQEKYTKHSSMQFTGFPRFKHFIMSASSPTDDTIVADNIVPSRKSIVSHIEYRSNRYSVTTTQSNTSSKYTSDSYELSESESDEESEETRSSEIDISSIQDDDDDDVKIIDKNIDNDTKRQKKLENIANELLETEIKYVEILYLIDQIFQFRVDQENRAHPMFSQETVQKIFSNIKSIYSLHNEFLLPELKIRINNWNNEPRIGDIMKYRAPFLKMYTEYVKNFDNAMNLISTLQQKIPKFANIINEIQKLDICGKLTLSHHMLCPIQRLPRYELLLKDYIRNLNIDNPDYNDSKKALELVSIAANHTNEAMKKIDKFKKLLEIQESIRHATDLVSRSRELIKEGRIVKISARSGDHQDRYLFLFNDILLLCSIRLIPPRTPPYRLRAKFYIENLHVTEGDNLEIANTFYIRDGNKNVELYTESIEEKTAWLDALFQTIDDNVKRKASLKITDNYKKNGINSFDVDDDYDNNNYNNNNNNNNNNSNRCIVCDAIFNVIKRKHHCRSCGSTVCNKCLNQKIEFEVNKQMKVCRLCYNAWTKSLNKSSSSSSSSSTSGPVSSLLCVSANESCVLSGNLLLKTQATKAWEKRWFSLHTDFVLYSFRSVNDTQALTATPMPGYTLTEGAQLPDEDALSSKDRIGTFKIHHSRKCYYLYAKTPEDKKKWTNALKLAMKAELPSNFIENNDDYDKNKPNESIDSLN